MVQRKKLNREAESSEESEKTGGDREKGNQEPRGREKGLESRPKVV